MYRNLSGWVGYGCESGASRVSCRAMHRRIRAFLAVCCVMWLGGRLLAQDAGQVKGPPKLPEQLLPREILEKLYSAEIPKYQAADYDKMREAHVLLEKYFLTDSAEDRHAITKLLVQGGIDAAVLGRMCRIHL